MYEGFPSRNWPVSSHSPARKDIFLRHTHFPWRRGSNKPEGNSNVRYSKNIYPSIHPGFRANDILDSQDPEQAGPLRQSPPRRSSWKWELSRETIWGLTMSSQVQQESYNMPVTPV
ncbi:Aspartate--tRNA ligase, cytoplasmic [Fusarium oxysporum f. sp. albedinis]|nr:Aspartate--tRNA ligase, cytoplasmic [Fusarium oxysporum f. sp. albedinis]